MAKLGGVARRTGACIVVVFHLSEQTGVPLGATAIRAYARVTPQIDRAPLDKNAPDDGRRRLRVVKTNDAYPEEDLVFYVPPKGEKQKFPHIEWGDKEEDTVLEVKEQAQPVQQPVPQAENFEYSQPAQATSPAETSPKRRVYTAAAFTHPYYADEPAQHGLVSLQLANLRVFGHELQRFDEMPKVFLALVLVCSQTQDSADHRGIAHGHAACLLIHGHDPPRKVKQVTGIRFGHGKLIPDHEGGQYYVAAQGFNMDHHGQLPVPIVFTPQNTADCWPAPRTASPLASCLGGTAHSSGMEAKGNG
jgi:hypothetical protein